MGRSGAGPSMSLDKGGAPSGVGNYKGVMLCNRPFAGSVAVKNPSGGNSKATFSCGLVPEAAGINVSINKKEEHKVKRPKKETVLTKHRRWLADLQKTKDKLEMQYIDEIRAKEASKDAFQKQERQMRNMSKELLDSNDDKSSDAKDSPGPESNIPPAHLAPAASNKAEAKMLNRPAWALTEKTAETKAAVNENKEFDDDEGLLDFAQNLDYDRFMSDIEVKTMMKKLQERIASLEHDVKEENSREADAEERAIKREMLASAQQLNQMAGEDGADAANDENLQNIAKLMLAEDTELSAVHSQQSVQNMLKMAKEKIATVKGVADAKYNPDSQKPKGMGNISGGPQIVLHEPNEGMRIDGKNSVSNLPYMHRNPAV